MSGKPRGCEKKKLYSIKMEPHVHSAIVEEYGSFTGGIEKLLELSKTLKKRIRDGKALLQSNK